MFRITNKKFSSQKRCFQDTRGRNLTLVTFATGEYLSDFLTPPIELLPQKHNPYKFITDTTLKQLHYFSCISFRHHVLINIIQKGYLTIRSFLFPSIRSNMNINAIYIHGCMYDYIKIITNILNDLQSFRNVQRC